MQVLAFEYCNWYQDAVGEHQKHGGKSLTATPEIGVAHYESYGREPPPHESATGRNSRRNGRVCQIDGFFRHRREVYGRRTAGVKRTALP